MYTEYYGFSADPFRLTADNNNLYSHQSLVKARSYLQYGLQIGEGIVLLTGGSGTGKTTLVETVVNEELDANLDPVIIECVDYSGQELLQHYASILSGEDINADIPDALNIITHSLVEARSQGKQCLLVLDEAHQLQQDALNKLTLLSNLRVEGHHLLQMFLVGQQELRETMLKPELEHLHQRLVATCRIKRLRSEETKEYIVQSLATVGWNGTPAISPTVFAAIHKTSMGIPRWINLICSRLMLHGMVNQLDVLDLPDVCEVLRDLLQEDLLPAAVRQANRAKSASLKAA
jgi:type II secretory pathway predicted ATPase ExeA